MKILKPSFLAVVLFVVAIGCKKNDFSNEKTQEADLLVTEKLISSTSADSTGWAPSAEWKVTQQEDFAVYYININDKAITADVVDNGLVLVFKKSKTGVNALPIEEGAKTQSKYWYHQVTEGNILISVDSYGSDSAPDASSSFKYLVVTPEKIKALEAKGFDVSQLMELSYEQAFELF